MDTPEQDAPEAPPNHDRRNLRIAAALVVVLLVYAVVLHARLSKAESDSAKAIAAHLQTIQLQTRQVEALDTLATRIDRFNREFGASLGHITVEPSGDLNLHDLKQAGHLPDDAQKTLADFEKSAAEIQAMTTELKELERFLGAPATVKRGDTHAELAKAYLVDEAKLSPQQADEVLRKTALTWELEPGNHVFNLYREGMLLSSVTQGTAKRSPLAVQWAQRRALEARLHELEAKLAATTPSP